MDRQAIASRRSERHFSYAFALAFSMQPNLGLYMHADIFIGLSNVRNISRLQERVFNLY